MKKVALLITVFAIAASVQAQNEMVGVNIDTKEILELTGVKAGDYMVVAGQTALESYSLLLLRPNKELVHRVNISRQALKVQGIAKQEDSFTVFLTSSVYGGAERVEQFTFAESTGAFSPVKEVKSVVFPDKVVGGFTNQHDFCLVTAQKKARTLTFERFAGGSVVSKKEFTISDEKLFKAVLKKDFVVIPPGQQIPFEQAKELHKVYWQGDRLVFTFEDMDGEGAPGVTLLTLDVQAGTSVVHRIAMELEPNTKHNSFLYADTLFVVGINRQALQLAVFSMRDYRPLQQLSYQRGSRSGLKLPHYTRMGKMPKRNGKYRVIRRKYLNLFPQVGP